MRIGFIGLGHMGDGMARRLIAAGNDTNGIAHGAIPEHSEFGLRPWVYF